MKTQNTKLLFSKTTLIELQNYEMSSVKGGTFSTNSESGPLCDMLEIISRAFTR